MTIIRNGRVIRGGSIEQVVAVHHDSAAEEAPVDMAACEEFLMEDFAAQQVGQQHTESDGQQEQGLELLDDGQVQQHTGNADHDQRLGIRQEHEHAGGLPQTGQRISNELHGITHFLSVFSRWFAQQSSAAAVPGTDTIKR
jgi:hypothetical protein